jgi:hypothetical protein
MKSSPRGYHEIFAGAGIGMLVGLLIGLSVSPVVGTILGALAALLATFLGLHERSDFKEQAETPVAAGVRALRSGSFGFACVMGVLLGMLIRTQGFLSMSVKQQLAIWTQAGYKEEDAKNLVVYQTLGIVPAGWSVAEDQALAPKKSASVLFSTKIAERCNELESEKFANVAEELNAYRLEGGKWAALADSVERYVPRHYQRAVLQAVWKLKCQE